MRVSDEGRVDVSRTPQRQQGMEHRSRRRDTVNDAPETSDAERPFDQGARAGTRRAPRASRRWNEGQSLSAEHRYGAYEPRATAGGEGRELARSPSGDDVDAGAVSARHIRNEL